jgi:hypothetical protein
MRNMSYIWSIEKTPTVLRIDIPIAMMVRQLNFLA